MKKKYTKPELRKLKPQPLPRDPLWINGIPIDLTVPHSVAGAHYTSGKPSIELGFSKVIEPEIRFNPTELPESVSILGPKCPICGTRSQEMVLYGVIGGNSLSKNHCGKCGHNWGPGE